jgi:hypothetical protein
MNELIASHDDKDASCQRLDAVMTFLKRALSFGSLLLVFFAAWRGEYENKD